MELTVADKVNQLTIAFWNCGIAPSTKRAKVRDASKFQCATQLINQMMLKDIDIICLVEVSVEYNDFLKTAISLLKLPYILIDGATQLNTVTRFDTCLIYNTNTVKNFKPISIIKTAISGANNIKAGQVYYLNSFGKNICLILSHWPSKTADQKKQRQEAARKLREWINDTQNSSFSDNLILMGDYNAQPYNEEMTDFLQSSYSKVYCLFKPIHKYLYNPSWKFLYDMHNYHSLEIHEPTSYEPGTCYYDVNTQEKWSVFDQVLFTPAFLDKLPGLKYVDQSLSIINLSLSDKKSQWSIEEFDHLPLIFKLKEL